MTQNAKTFQNLNGYDSLIPSTPYILKGPWKGGYLFWDHSFMPNLEALFPIHFGNHFVKRRQWTVNCVTGIKKELQTILLYINIANSLWCQDLLVKISCWENFVTILASSFMKKWNASFYQSIVHVVEKCLKSNALLFWFWITTQKENNWNCLLLEHIAYSWITRNTSVLDSIPWDFDFSHRFTFWPYRVYHKVKQNSAICLYYLTFQPFFLHCNGRQNSISAIGISA